MDGLEVLKFKFIVFFLPSTILYILNRDSMFLMSSATYLNIFSLNSKRINKRGLIDVTSKMDKQRLYIYMPKIKDQQFYYYNKEKKSNKYTYDRFINVLNIKSKHTLKNILIP